MNQLPPMTLFDYMVSSKENNMLKAFLPYVDREFQPLLAVYIKYTELIATVELFKNKKDVFGSCSSSNDFTNILEAFLPYISKEEQDTFETVMNIKNIMSMYNMFNNDESDLKDDVSATTAAFLTPEQQLMFQQLSEMM